MFKTFMTFLVVEKTLSLIRRPTRRSTTPTLGLILHGTEGTRVSDYLVHLTTLHINGLIIIKRQKEMKRRGLPLFSLSPPVNYIVYNWLVDDISSGWYWYGLLTRLLCISGFIPYYRTPTPSFLYSVLRRTCVYVGTRTRNTSLGVGCGGVSSVFFWLYLYTGPSGTRGVLGGEVGKRTVWRVFVGFNV